MIKAYRIDYKDTPYRAKIFWAESANIAKSLALFEVKYDDYSYIELRVKRVPWADELYRLSNWDLLKERIKHGETFSLEDPSEDLAVLTKHDLDKMNQFKSEDEYYRAWRKDSVDTYLEAKRLKEVI